MGQVKVNDKSNEITAILQRDNMVKKTFVILGGYGNAGFQIARLLLQETNVELILVGRNIEKAEYAAEQLNNISKGNRVLALEADVTDENSLRKCLSGADLVLVASSTSQSLHRIAKVVIELGLDYLDLWYSPEKTSLMKSMKADIEASNSCFITQGGLHPGIPSALIRYLGSSFFDCVNRVIVASFIKTNWERLSFSEATLSELEEKFRSDCFIDGKWQQPLEDCLEIDFGDEFGLQKCRPIFLGEMSSLPKLFPTLEYAGFYLSREHGHQMPPPYFATLKVEVNGKKNENIKTIEMFLICEDGYTLTGIAVTACLLQYLNGSIHQIGLWEMGNLVNPTQLISDMKRMDVKFTHKII